MARSSLKVKISHIGNGVTTAFPYDFPMLLASNAVVVLTDTSGVETTQSQGSNYAITVTPSGGTITFVVAPPNGYTITIKKVVPITQGSDWVDGNAVNQQTFEDAVDKLTDIALQLQEQIDRSPKFRVSSAFNGVAFPQLVPGKAIRVSNDGSSLVCSTNNFDTIVQDATVQANVATAQAINATASATAAAHSADVAEDARTDANNAATFASASAVSASQSATSAIDAKTLADTAVNNATTIYGSISAVQSAATSASNSASIAISNANAAAASALTADASRKWATEAENIPVSDGVHNGFSSYHWAMKSTLSVTLAQQYANTAGTKAGEAASSAASALTSANTATTKATAATNAATQAANSAAQAASYVGGAFTPPIGCVVELPYASGDVFKSIGDTQWMLASGSIYTPDVPANYVNVPDYIRAEVPTTKTLSPSLTGWCQVSMGGDAVIAVQSSGNGFAKSVDGKNWTQGTLPVNSPWNSITYANGLFIIIGGNVSLVSADLGQTWQVGYIPYVLGASPARVAFGNGVFVLSTGANTSTYYTSSDALNWTARTYTSPNYCYSIAFGNGRFITVPSTGVNALVSTDGITWTASTLPNSAIWTIGYGDKFVAVSSTSVVVTSTDGVTWTPGTIPNVSSGYKAVAYKSGTWVAIGGASGTTAAAYSSDGSTWYASVLPIGVTVTSLATGTLNASTITHIAVSTANLTTIVSSNAVDWYSMQSSWNAVAFGNGVFVTVPNGTHSASTSDNGDTWTFTAMPTGEKIWRDVCYGDGKFVAVRNNDTAAVTSNNGATWVAATMPTSIAWSLVNYGNGLFVAVCSNSNTIATSPDGVTWTSRTLPVSMMWGALAFGSGKFVLTASNTAISFVSSDGITWTPMALPLYGAVKCMTYGGGKFVGLMTGNDKVIISSDGINWITSSGPSSSVSDLAYSNGRYMAVSSSASCFVSVDGENWKQRSMPINTSSSSIAGGDTCFMAVSLNSAQVPYQTIREGFFSGEPYALAFTGQRTSGATRSFVRVK